MNESTNGAANVEFAERFIALIHRYGQGSGNDILDERMRRYGPDVNIMSIPKEVMCIMEDLYDLAEKHGVATSSRECAEWVLNSAEILLESVISKS